MPDQRIKTVDLGGIYARQGEWVTCENDHYICMFNESVRTGGAFNEETMIMWRQPAPKIGDPMPTCRYCTGAFVRDGSIFHFYDGWRMVGGARPTSLAGWLKKLWNGLAAKAK